MKRYTVILALCVSALFAACSLIDSDKRMIRGHYKSTYEQRVVDGIPADIHLDVDEELAYWSFHNNVDMKVVFYFNEFDFSNLTLTYKIDIEGSWDYDKNKLIVDVDTTTFRYEFLGSDAQTPTERAMVRQLCNNVVVTDLMPKVRKKLLNMSQRSVVVYELSEKGMVVEEPLSGGKIEMKRIE